MIEIYCDSCGTRILGKKYIKGIVEIGQGKPKKAVEAHAYAHGGDLCQSCLLGVVAKAKDGEESL